MSRRLPSLKPKQVIRALERAGFYHHHSRGGHRYYKHPDAPKLRVTVPFHSQDLKRSTLRSIIEQAGLSTEEFTALL